jgi:hypothetical protein
MAEIMAAAMGAAASIHAGRLVPHVLLLLAAEWPNIGSET